VLLVCRAQHRKASNDVVPLQCSISGRLDTLRALGNTPKLLRVHRDMEAAGLPAGHKPLQVLLVHRSIVQQEKAHHCCALPKQQLRKARCCLHSSHFLLTPLPALQRKNTENVALSCFLYCGTSQKMNTTAVVLLPRCFSLSQAPCATSAAILLLTSFDMIAEGPPE